MIERKYVHPHDNRYIVVDVLNDQGDIVRTYNEIQNKYFCACGRMIWIK